MGGRASRELAEVTERLGQARTECEYRQSGVDGEQQGPARSNDFGQCKHDAESSENTVEDSE